MFLTFFLNSKQDGPSLESSLYLNVTLRYLGPSDPLTLGLLDFGLCFLFHHLLMLPLTSTYLFLLLPRLSYLLLSLPSSSYELLLPPTSFFSSFCFCILLHPSTSFYFLLHPFTSFYLLLSPNTSWFYMVWYGGEEEGGHMMVLFEFWHWILSLEMDLKPLYWH